MVSKDQIAEQDRRKTRRASLAVTLTKTDRIITGRGNVTFQFTDGPPPSLGANPPAWNDGKNIYVSNARMPSIESASDLVTCLGLNHHEIAHVLYTPSSGTRFISDLVKDGMWNTYNMLEDARIETMFSAQYISAKKYLTSPVLRFIVDNDKTWPTAHLLTYGRRYLPLEIRKEFAGRFIGSAAVRKEAEKIIDSYRMLDLSDSSDHPIADRLVRAMHVLLGNVKSKLGTDEKNAMEKNCGCGGLDNFQNDEMEVKLASQSAGRRRDEEAAEQDEKEKEGKDGSGFYDEDDSEDEEEPGDEGSGADTSEDDGDPSSESDGDSGWDDPEEGDDESDGSSGIGNSSSGDDDGSEAPGNSGGNSGSSDDDESEDGDGDSGSESVNGEGSNSAGNSSGHLESLVNKALEAIEENSEVRGELTRLRDAMDDDRNIETTTEPTPFQSRPPSAQSASALNEISREFQELHAKFEPGWEYATDHGRVNVQRAMTADFGETDIYDAWDEGQEEDAALEAVILFDDSGSMDGSKIVQGSEAVWAVKCALDSVDAISTVLTFSVNSRTLYNRGEASNHGEVKIPKDLGGSTNPTTGMMESRRILNQSERPNRLFVIVTDGGFNGMHYFGNQSNGAGDVYKELLESIKATRVYIGIETASSPYLKDCYDVHTVINNPRDIATVIRQSIRSMLDEAYKRR